MPVIILRPWEKRVSGNATAAKISIVNDQVQYHLENTEGQNSYAGWYGIYDNELFGVFLDSTSKSIKIAAGEIILPIEYIISVEWQALIKHRHLLLVTSMTNIDFYYQKLWWNLLRRPWHGIFGVLLAEDWWGVTCDLPGWFADNWKSSELEKLVGRANETR
jgi:hypothetical protein